MNRIVSCLAIMAAVVGCRGDISSKPPIHIVPDMDYQQKFLPQAEISKDLFADGRAMRPMVEGAVAQGQERADDRYYKGEEDKDHYVAVAPVDMTHDRLVRGQSRYNIYCAPCHDRTGGGKGVVIQRGYPVPVDLNSDRVRAMSDGEIFTAISKGVRNMPSYAAQIPTDDRWSIVGWVRVLNRSQYATVEDVPTELRGNIAPGGM